MSWSLRWLVELWPHVASVTVLVVALAASGHAILNGRDTRATVGWVGIIWLAPIVGAVLYALLGINRIRRRAAALRRTRDKTRSPAESTPQPQSATAAWTPCLRPLARLIGEVTKLPLVEGNAVEPLVDGGAAYPEMLKAIDQATTSVNLQTYIFDNDAAGQRFARSLAGARRRGVDVRVIIDDAGARYSARTIVRQLRRDGISVVSFIPVWVPWLAPFANLRTHRKILVVDGRIGFTGGMNIRHGNLLEENPKSPIRDVHFRIEGPVVRQLQTAFADDWRFVTKETIEGGGWFPDVRPAGDVACRGVVDGPDEDIDKMRLAFLGALACARKSVRILTPYFLPDADMIASLNVTALRGVDVTIVTPEKPNIMLVRWAMWGILDEVLRYGIRLVVTPPPFDHSKVLVVDDEWVLFGSANWDPRSLRLNFEYGVECYDQKLATELGTIVDRKASAGRRVTRDEVLGRNVVMRLRDGLARLLQPYL